MMNLTLRYCVLVLVVCLQAAAGVAMAQTVTPLKQGELLRSTTGRGIDSSGFASISVPLKKGAIYDVVRQDNATVVLKVGGQNVVVQHTFVTITDKGPAPTVNLQGFVPGKIVLISAKYTLAGDQPRNVKNNLQKLIPTTDLTAPLEIIVTDGLSTAAQDESSGSQTAVVITGGGTTAIFTQSNTPAKNVLTVQYLYNGQRFTKQVPEGGKLVLP